MYIVRGRFLGWAHVPISRFVYPLPNETVSGTDIVLCETIYLNTKVHFEQLLPRQISIVSIIWKVLNRFVGDHTVLYY